MLAWKHAADRLPARSNRLSIDARHSSSLRSAHAMKTNAGLRAEMKNP
jgi:hypothetical protein